MVNDHATSQEPEWVEVIVEIPKGSRNKYEIDHDSGELWLDRHLFTATTYPADYGFVPDTLAEDGDPLDVLVLLDEPTVPGCHIWARLDDLEDASEHLLAEIRHFFEVYKALEPAKMTDVGRWAGRVDAWAEITAATERFGHQPSHGAP